MKKEFEPVTETIKDVSEDVTKIMMLTSKGSNKALENISAILLKIMNKKLKKNSNSKKVNLLLIHNNTNYFT